MAVLTRRMTAAEFMRMPDDGRKYELVDGEPKVVPAGIKHEVLVIHIGAMLLPAAKGRGFVAGSSAGYHMVAYNIRSPDVSFTLKERFLNELPPSGFADVCPDLCIEIISPSEEPADMARKVREYFALGAQIVWQMFSETETIKVYTSPDEFTLLTAQDEIDCLELLPGFRVVVSELFALE